MMTKVFAAQCYYFNCIIFTLWLEKILPLLFVFVQAMKNKHYHSNVTMTKNLRNFINFLIQHGSKRNQEIWRSSTRWLSILKPLFCMRTWKSLVMNWLIDRDASVANDDNGENTLKVLFLFIHSLYLSF